MQGLEAFAVINAIAYVFLAARQSIWCWLFAFVSTVCYVVVFWQVSLPFQTALNAYYVLMAGYGYWQWQGSKDDKKPVTTMTIRQHILIVGGILITTLVVAQIWREIAFTPFVHVDVFVTIASVTTTVLVAHKKLENWLYWIVINMVTAWLCWQVSLYLTSGLYLLYCGLSIYGHWQWRKDSGPQARATN